MIRTIPTNTGPQDFDVAAIWRTALDSFRADYADDPAVVSETYRNGDLARADFDESVKHLSPERCAQVTREQIERFLIGAARSALCSLVLASHRTMRTARK